MMRNVLFLAVLGLLAVNIAWAQGASVKVSQQFATAQEAVNAANALPKPYAWLRFACHYADGSTSPSTYYTVSGTGGTHPELFYDGLSSQTEASAAWTYREFQTLAEAVKFSSEINNWVWPQIVACYNPNRNPQSTTFTVFYLDIKSAPRQGVPKFNFELIEKEFPSAEAAAEYANSMDFVRHLFVQFVAEFHPNQNLKSTWRIVTGTPSDTQGEEHGFFGWSSDPSSSPSPFRWQVFRGTREEIGRFLLDYMLNPLPRPDDTILNVRIVEEFDTYSTSSKTVLFYLVFPRTN